MNRFPGIDWAYLKMCSRVDQKTGARWPSSFPFLLPLKIESKHVPPRSLPWLPIPTHPNTSSPSDSSERKVVNYKSPFLYFSSSTFQSPIANSFSPLSISHLPTPPMPAPSSDAFTRSPDSRSLNHVYARPLSLLHILPMANHMLPTAISWSTHLSPTPG